MKCPIKNIIKCAAVLQHWIWPVTPELKIKVDTSFEWFYSTLKMLNNLNVWCEGEDEFHRAQCTWMWLSEGEELGVFNECVQFGPHLSAPFKQSSGSAWGLAELILSCFFWHSLNFETVTLCCYYSYSPTVYSGWMWLQFRAATSDCEQDVYLFPTLTFTGAGWVIVTYSPSCFLNTPWHSLIDSSVNQHFFFYLIFFVK